MKTLADIERLLERKLQSLVRSGELRPIVGDDWPVHVTLQRSSGPGKVRKARKDASATYWDDYSWRAGSFQFTISAGEAPDLGALGDETSPDVPRLPQPAGARRAHANRVSDDSASQTDAFDQVIGMLDEAESRRDFVALKWFRDVPLRQAMPIKLDSDRQKLIDACIEQGIIRTHRVDNPEKPEWPVTAIRLNRAHPAVRGLSRRAPEPSKATSRFSPVSIRGGPLSRTIIQDRR